MILNIEKIKKVILSSAEELKIDLNDYDFYRCNELLNKSESLKKTLEKSIKQSVKREEIDNINNNLVQTIVELYIDQKDIEVIDEDDVYYFADGDDLRAPLDAFSLFMKDISYYSVPTKEEEEELFVRYNNGDISAKEEIINRNQRLVVSIAKKFVIETYDVLNAIQDGNFGLMKAIEDFDVTKGYRFSTYATWWIRQAINRSRNKSNNIIHISSNLQSYVNKYNAFINKFYLENGYKPSLEDIADGMNITVDRVKEIMNVPILSASLNSAISEDADETELGDMIADDKNLSPETETILAFLKRDLNEEMNLILNKREKEVLIYRFGLIGNSELTLKQVARIMGTTYEKVKMIESKALKKLHHRCKRLELYIRD